MFRGENGTFHAWLSVDHPIEFHPDAPMFCTKHQPSVSISRRPNVGMFISAGVDDRPSLPAWQWVDQDAIREGMTEHQLMMNPDPAGGEMIFGLAEHLGEGQDIVDRHLDCPGHPLHGTVTGQWLVPKVGLSNLEKIIFYEAGMTAQGQPCLPHEDRSRRAWWLFAGGIRRRYACTEAEAEALCEAWKELGVTSKLAVEFDRWIAKSGIEKAVPYFTNLRSELQAVTCEADPEVGRYAEDDPEEEPDEPVVRAESWHLLDDPRDEAVPWEGRQPWAYRKLLAGVRRMNLAEIKAFSQSLYGKPPANLTKDQLSVLWGEVKLAKKRLTPPLRPFAQKVIARLRENPKSKKASFWLYNEGAKQLNATELQAAWAVVKA